MGNDLKTNRQQESHPNTETRARKPLPDNTRLRRRRHLDDELCVSGDAGAELSGQSQRLVETVGVQGLRAACRHTTNGHTLNTHTHSSTGEERDNPQHQNSCTRVQAPPQQPTCNW